MKGLKRKFSLAIIVAMIIGMLPVSVFAAELPKQPKGTYEAKYETVNSKGAQSVTLGAYADIDTAQIVIDENGNSSAVLFITPKKPEKGKLLAVYVGSASDSKEKKEAGKILVEDGKVTIPNVTSGKEVVLTVKQDQTDAEGTFTPNAWSTSEYRCTVTMTFPTAKDSLRANILRGKLVSEKNQGTDFGRSKYFVKSIENVVNNTRVEGGKGGICYLDSYGDVTITVNSKNMTRYWVGELEIPSDKKTEDEIQQWVEKELKSSCTSAPEGSTSIDVIIPKAELNKPKEFWMYNKSMKKWFGYNAFFTRVTPVSDVKFKEREVTYNMAENKVLDLSTNLTVTPEDGYVEWFSSDETVATVSDKGVITGVAPGTTDIKATSVDGVSSATCKLTVINRVDATSLTFKEACVVIDMAKTNTKTADMASYLVKEPASATVKWSSSDTKVATIDENGLATGLNAGTTNITAESTDGKLKVSCKLVVKQSIPTTSLKFKKKSYTFDMKKAKSLTVDISKQLRISPSNAYVTWSTSNSKIATIDQTGLLTGIKSGNVTVKAENLAGKTVSMKVKVVAPKKLKKITVKSGSVKKGKTKSFKVTLNPASAHYTKVKWTSSDKSVAKITKNSNKLQCTVKGIKEGKATLTVTVDSLYGSFTKTAEVTVTKK